MRRPNLAMDAPPTTITVGGVAYDVDVDYTTWIEVYDMIRDLWSEEGHEIENLIKIYEIEIKVFGGRIEADASEAMDAIIEFLNGYPEQELERDDENKPEVIDFANDINAIVVAIRNQTGIDISYKRKEPYHWWLFLNEFRCLAGEHWITKLMEIRGYDGDNREQQKLRYKYSLPPRMTPEERQAEEELNRILGI